MATQIVPQQRARIQAPIAAPRFVVAYLKQGIEHFTPWLHSRERAQKALSIMQKRYGPRNCVIVMD